MASVLVQKYISTFPLMLFVKSYCPYCQKAQRALAHLETVPAVQSLAFDLVEFGHTNTRQIQRELQNNFPAQAHTTVPVFFSNGVFVGGSDEVQRCVLTSRNREKQ